MQINFNIIRVNSLCDKMIEVMRKNYDSIDRKVNVTDLESALKNKKSEDVTKDFVAATSFILSKALGGAPAKGKGKKAGPTKKRVLGDSLWQTKDFECGQFFS